MCTVSNNIETSMLNAYICPHSFTPLATKAQIPQRCGRDYTKETGISRQHSGARHSNGGKPEDAPQLYGDVTTILQTRHLRSSRRQISRWPRRLSKHTGGGGLFLPSCPSFFQCFICASLFRNKVHTQDYSCIMVQRPVRHSGTFSARCKSMCVVYNTD